MWVLDLDITFKNNKLAKILNDRKKLLRVYGAPNSKRIMMRLEFLRASVCLDDVPRDPPYRLHALHHNREGQFAVDLEHPQRLVFEPNHNPLPRLKDSSVDLKRVTAITILEVEDYH
jgi:proteic killer suppression protein